MAPDNAGSVAGEVAAPTAIPAASTGHAEAGKAPNGAAPFEPGGTRPPAVENRSGQSKPPHGARDSQAAVAAEPAAGFPDNWRHEMAGGDRAFLKMLDRFESPAALAKAYKELTAKLSSGELRAMKPPGDKATAEEVAAWRIDHGLPEDPAAYVAGLAFPDGTVPGEADQPMLASFAERAAKGNWTGQQYNEAVGWYFAMQDQLAAQRQIADAAFKAEASSDLMREWGTDYAVNRNAVAQFLDRNFPQQFRIDMLNARLADGRILANDPAFNRAILELAKLVSPVASMLPNASGGRLSNVESRIAEIEAKYMRAAHGSDAWKGYWTGDSGARMQQEYRGLIASREQVRRGATG